MANGTEEMIMMRRWQQQGQQKRQQQFASAWRPCERLRERKRHDPLLCKCLVAMGMYHFVDHFDNFNQFIRMSSDQCRLYGPEFVVKYAKLHTRIETLCASAFSALDDFGPCHVVDVEPNDNDDAGASFASSVASSAAAVAAVPGVATTQRKNLSEEEEEEEGHRDRVQPHPPLRRSDSLSPGSGGDSSSLIPCTEEFCWDDGFNDSQTIRVCSHLIGTCDAIQRWSRRNLQN